MATCKISNDIIFNCESPPVAGAKDRVIILPRRSKAGITLNSTNHLIVEEITKVSNQRAYEYVGTSTLLKSDKGLVSSEFGHAYRHRLPFRIYGNTPEIKQQLEYLVNETDGVIAILENNYQGNAGNAVYEVFGKDVGLRVVMLEDTEGKQSYAIELASSDDSPEPHLPATFWKTDLATTKALVEGLLVATSP